jgi:hypothetical protein
MLGYGKREGTGWMKIKIASTALLSAFLISASSPSILSSPPPSFLSSLSSKTLLLSLEIEFQIQATKQKAALSDILTISYVLADFITDPNEFPYQAGSYDKNSKIYKALCPYYIEELPLKDPWGNDYHIYCGAAGNGQYGIFECISNDFVVVSLGMDGKKEAWRIDLAEPEAGIFKAEAPDDFNKDLVCWTGSWVRAPADAASMFTIMGTHHLILPAN